MAMVLPASGHRRTAWRNGGGVTDEIAVAAHPHDPARFAWRLSIAHVAAAGPFSSYPGVDRTLLLVDGVGIDLRFGDEPWRRFDRCFEPIAFAGETPVDCRLLDGPVRDFNVMVDRATTGATVGVFTDSSIELGADDAETALARVVVVLEGTASLRGDGCVRLGLFDAVRVGAAEHAVVDLAPAGRAAVVVFTKRV